MYTFFNNKTLEDVVPGYTTANVEGRGILNRSLITVDIPGRNGSYVLDQKLPPREIIVHYRMTADNSIEFLEQMNILHEVLTTDGDVEFQFSDEIEYRKGRLIASEDPPYDYFRGFGSFTMFCQDPFKYRDISEITGADVTTGGFGLYPYKINSISAAIATTRTGFEVLNFNTGRKILLTGSFTAGQKLVISPESGAITLNGQNIKERLDFIASDWTDFKIKPGDRIISSQPIIMNLSERRL